MNNQSQQSGMENYLSDLAKASKTHASEERSRVILKAKILQKFENKEASKATFSWLKVFSFSGALSLLIIGFLAFRTPTVDADFQVALSQTITELDQIIEELDSDSIQSLNGDFNI